MSSPAEEDSPVALPLMPIATLDTSVVDLVDHWSAKTPNAIAAEWKGQILTYAQLRDASLYVTQALLSRGSRPSAMIPLLTQMSLEMLPCIIGILRTGACYVPIDVVAWSKDRIEAAIEAVAPSIVVATTSTHGLRLPTTVQFHPEILNLPFECEAHFTRRLDMIRHGLSPDSLAYIIFTSGTTGKPKGVMVPHRAIHNLVSLKEGDVLKITPGKRVLLTFSVGFDGCAGIVWTTLTNGGTLVMANSSDFPERGATCQTLILTPSMLATLDPTSGFDTVEEIYLGGEASNISLIRPWITPTRHVYNSYGPSEATVAVTVARMNPHEEPILGHVIPGVKLVLVDEEMNEAEVGEIMIAGPCLATGYINNPELTAKKFIQWNGQRYYRTGDRARRTERGLEWAGRVDRLVKNRGFLINLESEVEPALLRFDAIRAATAFIWRGKMIACVQPAGVDVEELRTYLKANFDHFIVPDEILAMDNFPLTANSKVDWNALRTQLDDRLISDNANISQEGKSALDIVRKAFAEILLVPPKDLDEDSSFAKLGGNSLSAIKLSQFLRKNGYSISIGEIIKGDTLGLIHNSSKLDETSSAKIQNEQKGPVPVTDMQRLMLSQSQTHIAENFLIFKMQYVGSPAPSPSELRKAWAKVLSHHSIFRMVFDLDKWTQEDSGQIHLDSQEVFVDESQYESTVETHLQACWREGEVNTPLRLDIPYSSMSFIAVPEKKAVTVLWRVHHVLIDGFSTALLIQELAKALEGEDLAPSPDYRDYALFYQQYKKDNAKSVEKLWTPLLEPLKTMTPLQIVRPSEIPESGTLFHSDMTSTDTTKGALYAAAQNFGVSNATLVYAAWALTLRRLTGSNAASFATSASGRMVPWGPASSLVGTMQSRVPVCIATAEDKTLAEWLLELRDLLAELLEFQSLCSPLSASILSPEDFNTHFNTMVQSFLGMSASSNGWDVVDMQPPSFQLVWFVWEDGEDVVSTIQVRPGQVDPAWASKVNLLAAKSLQSLVTAQPDTKLRDL
ncbi:putative nonribosomal peptide synthase [Nemania sp. FL0916]|nr:putative nonribosomal peptide synthase [Nemania sp. FL0916]